MGISGIVALSRLVVRSLILTAALAAAGASGAAAQERVLRLDLVETVPTAPYGRWLAIQSGGISERDPNGTWSADYSWSSPPAAMGADGFTMTITTTAQTVGSQTYSGGTSVQDKEFATDPEEAYAKLNLGPGESNSTSMGVRVTPRGLPADGGIVELDVGAAYGPRVIYKYRVSYSGGDVAGPDGEDPDEPDEPHSQLAVTTDCPSTITISSYPPVLCHLYVTGFRRNTADAIFVELPAADGFGNQPNGLNVVGRTQQDVYGLGDTFVTDLVIFACPSRANEARNCFDNATVPGLPITVPVLVRQGEQAVQIDLPFTPNSSSKDKDTQPGVDNPTLIVTNRVYIFGAWRRDSFLNIQNNLFQFSPVTTAWADAEWVGEKLADANGEFIRLCVARLPDTCLQVVGGALVLAPTTREDPASHWGTPYADAAGGIVNIRSRAFPTLFLHARDGVPAVAEIDFNWPEAQWGMQAAQ